MSDTQNLLWVFYTTEKKIIKDENTLIKKRDTGKNPVDHELVNLTEVAMEDASEPIFYCGIFLFPLKTIYIMEEETEQDPLSIWSDKRPREWREDWENPYLYKILIANHSHCRCRHPYHLHESHLINDI